MAGRILHKTSVRYDLKQIDRKNVDRIVAEIRAILGDDQRAGEALAGEFKGLFKLLVGDYRVIYTLIQNDVLVLRIRHRAKAYES